LIIHSNVGVFVGSCYADCKTCTGPFFYDCTSYPGYGLAALTTAAPTTGANAKAIAGCVLPAWTGTAFTCLKADAGFYLDSNNLAVACVANCAVCTAAAFAGCTTAAPGFFKDTAEIKACSAHCLTCTSATVCTACDTANGWGLSSDKCVN
jgi:hypothetical protein